FPNPGGAIVGGSHDSFSVRTEARQLHGAGMPEDEWFKLIRGDPPEHRQSVSARGCEAASVLTESGRTTVSIGMENRLAERAARGCVIHPERAPFKAYRGPSSGTIDDASSVIEPA